MGKKITVEQTGDKERSKLVKRATETLHNQFKHALQGICRLDVTTEEISQILHKYPPVEAFATTYETDANDPHCHWIVYSSKRLSIQPLREHFKKEIENLGKAPKKYLNGMFNISPDELIDYFKSLCYILKDYEQATFTSATHNIQTWIVTLAKQESYRKHGKVSRILKAIHKELLKGIITPHEATIKYIRARCESGKPDPYIVKAFDNFNIMYISREDEILVTHIQNTLIEAGRI